MTVLRLDVLVSCSHVAVRGIDLAEAREEIVTLPLEGAHTLGELRHRLGSRRRSLGGRLLHLALQPRDAKAQTLVLAQHLLREGAGPVEHVPQFFAARGEIVALPVSGASVPAPDHRSEYKSRGGQE